MHMHMDMDMGSDMPMPSSAYLARVFWAAVGTAIAVATMVNIIDRLILRQRLKGIGRHKSPARPQRILPQIYASLTALTREVSNAPVLMTTLGRIIIVVAELVLVIVLCFYGFNLLDSWSWETIGYRTGYISATQIPLVVILAGKWNMVGGLIGSTYERLNWIHRWVARVLFLTVTIHMIFWFRSWAQYDYIGTKLTTDKITQRGFAAWVILLWIVASSALPVRRWNYEFFVLQHILTMIGFLAAVYLHLPDELKIYIWIPVALYALDRLLRFVVLLYTNLSPRSRDWSCQATLEPLCSDVSRLTIAPSPMSWQAGQHVFLSCHGIAPLQSHPFTIASLPADDRMDFLIKAKKGATKRISCHASRSGLPTAKSGLTVSAIVEGPYGRIRSLRQFDSVFLIAGSTGSSFTVPLLRDIVAAKKCAVTRVVRFVWVVKSSQHYSWFAKEFAQLLDDIQDLRQSGRAIEVNLTLFVTCDQSYTIQPERQPCLPKGSCCCTRTTTDSESAEKHVCRCNDEPPAEPSSLVRPLLGSTEGEKPGISVVTGRPAPRRLIQRMLENAQGESAVVVCGPRGLVQDVRRAFVSLSDERAVHKGTGAQGIYFWAEQYGY